MKRFFFSLFMALFAISAVADTIEVNNFNYAGPFNLKQPVMMDSLNLASKKFSNAAFLDKFIDLSLVRNGREMTTNQLPKKSDITQMHLIGFTIANERYAKADFVVKGMKHYHLYVDGKKNDGKKVELTPAVHDVVVKYLTDQEEQMPMWGIKVTTADSVPIMAGLAGEKRSYQLSDVLHCWRFNKVSLSPDGNFLIAGYSTVQKDGKTAGKTLVKRVKDGAVIDQKTAASWMPTSNKYYFIRQVIKCLNPTTGNRTGGTRLLSTSMTSSRESARHWYMETTVCGCSTYLKTGRKYWFIHQGRDLKNGRRRYIPFSSSTTTLIRWTPSSPMMDSSPARHSRLMPLRSCSQAHLKRLEV